MPMKTGIVVLAVLMGSAAPPFGSGTFRALAQGGQENREARGWLSWRGPQQNGTSLEKGLPAKAEELWSIERPGRGTPVVADGRVYSWGYRGEGPHLMEVLACLEEATGKTIWEHAFRDFLSDVVYDRYSIGSPTIDAETGNVYLKTSPGLLLCFARDGKLVWQHSMVEAFGQNTYPNGRTGAPVIEGDLVIARGVTNNWGTQGPPRDRYYAFEKRTGHPVWESTVCQGPPFLKDSSFATAVLDWWEGRRVFYSAVGSGSVICANAWTGEPLWRSQQIVGGFNSSVVLHQGKVIAIHSGQNLDTTETGRMLAIKIPAADRLDPAKVPLELGIKDEAWRLPLCMFTSSPVLAGDRVYQVVESGELVCIDAAAGKILWEKKLGSTQLHASPLWAEGRLYVPMEDGTFWILKVSDSGAEELARVKLEGNCLGSPAAWNGKVYVHTTRKLYCFGSKGDNTANLPPPPRVEPPKPGPAVRLQIVPNEVLLRPGEKAAFKLYAIDAKGQRVGPVTEPVEWAKFVPPTALVKAEMDAAFNAQGEMVAGSRASAGSWKATAGKLSGTIRGRVVVHPPYREDFESSTFAPDPHPTEKVPFGFPPLPWIGGRFRWEVREKDGSKVLAKTTDNPFLSRALTFIGHPSESNYTIAADVMSDGNRRGMGEMGLINQRYIVRLKGNEDKIEVNSNVERLRVSAPVTLAPKVWYRLKTRVDMAPDGTATVRARVWKRGEAEPEGWTIEVKHEHGHANGVPGLYGLSTQPAFRVYVDNIEITPNK
jgi:outer membrane protein assembly factor BamB